MNFEAKLITHKGEKRIAVIFEKNALLINRIKTFEGARWSVTKKFWHLPDTNRYRLHFHLPLQATQLPNADAIEHLAKFINFLKAKWYSKNTITTYADCLKTFFIFFNNKMVSEITNDDIIRFHNEYIINNNFSSSYQNQIVNAIKLFFKIIQETEIEITKIHRPKRQKVLPNVLSKEEVKAILNALNNIKHKTMLSLIYSCGLRSGELISLELTQIDSKRAIILVKQAKGRKDRIVPLSPKILELLREYYTIHKPKKFLFEGQNPGEPYNSRSLQQVIKNATMAAKINKPVTLHWLRHSYATHLLESGTDLRYIQELLGHSSSRTTEIYTHVSTNCIQKIKSPFDDL